MQKIYQSKMNSYPKHYKPEELGIPFEIDYKLSENNLSCIITARNEADAVKQINNLIPNLEIKKCQNLKTT